MCAKKVKPISKTEAAMVSNETLEKIGGNTRIPRGTKARKANRSINPRKREVEAYTYRTHGYSYRQIAEFMGISECMAHKYVQAWMKNRIIDEREEVKAIHVDRLEQMREGLATMAMSGDVQAIDRMLKLDEREAKLRGFEEATKVEIIDNSNPVTALRVQAMEIFKRIEAQDAVAVEVKKKEGGG